MEEKLQNTINSIKEDMSIDRAIWVYHDKPERIPALGEIHYELTTEQFWEMFHEVWVNSESIFLHHEIINDMVSHHWSKLRFEKLCDEDHKFYNKLDNRFMIWRGCNKQNSEGWSWTTDIEKAKWFAQRWLKDDEEPLLISATVNKKDIIGAYKQRGEDEICVRPEDVTVKLITELEPENRGDSSSNLAFLIQAYGRDALFDEAQNAQSTALMLEARGMTIEEHTKIEEVIIEELFSLGFVALPNKRRKELEAVKKLYEEKSNEQICTENT